MSRYGANNVRRLKSTIRRLEQDPYAFVGPRGRPRMGWPLVIGLTASAISGRSGTQCGSGTVALYGLTPGGVLAPFEGNTSVNAYNIAAGSIPTAKYVVMGSVGSGWVVMTSEC
jgi:hypothetical protein